LDYEFATSHRFSVFHYSRPASNASITITVGLHFSAVDGVLRWREDKKSDNSYVRMIKNTSINLPYGVRAGAETIKISWKV